MIKLIFRQRAIRLAMSNGMKKATEMLTSTNQRVRLGRLYYSVEDSLVVEPVQNYENNDTFETFTWKKLNKIVVCNLTSVFELEHPKPRRLI